MGNSGIHGGAHDPARLAARALLRAMAEAAPPGLTAEAASEERRLYRALLALLRASDNPARDRHLLADPLSCAVARQKTRDGQALCAEMAGSLSKGDYIGAIDACRRLVSLHAGGGPAQAQREAA